MTVMTQSVTRVTGGGTREVIVWMVRLKSKGMVPWITNLRVI